jgi:hypothetical protein
MTTKNVSPTREWSVTSNRVVMEVIAAHQGLKVGARVGNYWYFSLLLLQQA